MRGILFALVFLHAQPVLERYGPLIRELSMTETQIAKLTRPFPSSPPVERILDDRQLARLEEIRKVYFDLDTRAGAIVMGLIDRNKWVKGDFCNRSTRSAQSAFELTDDQARRLFGNPTGSQVLLTASQKARVAAFEQNLELGREAVELHIMADSTLGGEVFCH